MMTIDELIASLQDEDCPAAITGPLAALWHDAKGDWHAAHGIVQDEKDDDSSGHSSSAWVHAYLHRKEPDLRNAKYWYDRANRAMPDDPLQREWREIATALLSH